MQYSNLKDEDQEEERDNKKVTKKIAITTEVLLKKKEFSLFLALILVLIITGSVIFFSLRAGGEISSPVVSVCCNDWVRQVDQQGQRRQQQRPRLPGLLGLPQRHQALCINQGNWGLGGGYYC